MIPWKPSKESPPRPSPFVIGEIVGSYRIVRKLGEGGMGEVYLAEHKYIARRAAIKFLLKELTS